MSFWSSIFPTDKSEKSATTADSTGSSSVDEIDSRTVIPLEIRWICSLGLVILIAGFLFSFRTVLNGPHGHRQADSIGPGYFYCIDPTAEFLKPKVGPRGDQPGIAINEFPIYSTLLGQICRWTGSWSEVTPRVVSLLFALISGLFFYLSLKKKVSPQLVRNSGVGIVRQASSLEFLFLFLLAPVTLTFFTIPMPESTSLLFISVAAFFWTGRTKNSGPTKLDLVLGLIGALVGFLIRPFYILVILFFAPSLSLAALTLSLCCFEFYAWYRVWMEQVTTNPGYFGVQSQTFIEILQTFPTALRSLPLRFFEHTVFIGTLSFVGLWRVERQWTSPYFRPVIFYFLSLGMMFALKSTHIPDHAYYLLNAGVFAVFAMWLSLPLMRKSFRIAFLLIFLIATIIHNQHNFHPNRNWDFLSQALADYNSRNAGDAFNPARSHVATYLGHNPQWLYFLKSTGYLFNPEDWSGTCPLGSGPVKATHYLKFLEEAGDPNTKDFKVRKMVLEHCPSQAQSKN